MNHFSCTQGNFFFQFKVQGGGGHGVYPTKPLSNFLSIVFRFITIFLNLYGFQNPKILQNSNISNRLFDTLFYIRGDYDKKYAQREENSFARFFNTTIVRKICENS